MSVHGRAQRTTQRAVFPALLAALFALGLVLVATAPYGIGVSPDSVGYIATARHIAAGQGVTTYDNHPLLVYPPFYPLVLAGGYMITGVDPLVVARFLNAFLFAAIVFLAGFWFSAHLPRCPVCVWIGMLSLLFALPLVYVSLMAWSEPLFITLLLFHMMLLDAYIEHPRTWVLGGLIGGVALAALTRYVGVLLLVTGSIGILLGGWRSGRRPRSYLTHVAFFLVGAVLPLGLWLGRNYLVSGTLFGPRPPSGVTLWQSVSMAMGTLLSWYVPPPALLVRYKAQLPLGIPDTLVAIYRGVYPLLIIAFGAAGGYLAVRRVRQRHEGVNVHSWATLSLLPPLFFVLIYVGFLMISATRVAYDQLGHRLLAPVYVPLTLFLLLLIAPLLEKDAFTGGRGVTRRFVMLLLGMWLLYAATVTALMVRKSMTEGLGYSARVWRESATARYVREHDMSCVFYSNDPNALYILTGKVGKMSPRKRYYNSPQSAGELNTLQEVWPPEGEACLVWFTHRQWNYLFTVEELAEVVDMQPLAIFDDGAVYRIRRRTASMTDKQTHTLAKE